MSEMVERVRNAVRDEYGSRLCAWIDMGSVRCCAINVPPHKCRCDEIARAAVAAMREPTGEMWSAGRSRFAAEAEKYRAQTTTVMADAHADKSPTLIYTAMIDAALSPSPSPQERT